MADILTHEGCLLKTDGEAKLSAREKRKMGHCIASQGCAFTAASSAKSVS